MKVGAKGQVVIPKAVRDRLDLRPGDEVVVDALDGEARVRRVTRADELLGMFAGGPSMTAELEREHVREIARDERRQRALDAGRMW
jgi:AbrB family looped-hinge helix DNA binding protein